MIEIRDLYKEYLEGGSVLSRLNLQVKTGERICIFGKSGSGKSTLLNILGGLENFDQGSVCVGEKKLYKMNEYQLSIYRREMVGFIFQGHHLLKDFNVLENITLAGQLTQRNQEKLEKKAQRLLEKLGLEDKRYRNITSLSGGEAQRVAIARSLINDPKILLADEATGNIDEQMSHDIVRDLVELSKDRGMTIVFVTHSKSLENYFDQSYELKEGKLK